MAESAFSPDRKIASLTINEITEITSSIEERRTLSLADYYLRIHSVAISVVLSWPGNSVGRVVCPAFSDRV